MATVRARSGASGEGPTAQISAGFGSLLGRVLDLSPADARIAVAAGIGSGIGAIFRAPLGGAVLGAEILYRDDIEGEAVMPSIVASVVGFSIFGMFEGFTPIFGFLRGYTFDHPVQLIYFALVGLAAGLVGRLYARSFYGVAALTRRLPGSPMVKPAVAGLLVGLLGLAVPGALGTGYGFVQEAMRGPGSELAVWVVLAMPFVKILATSLSIGSGGSGGIFGPGMVIGAFVGAGLWELLHPFAPSLPSNPAPLVVVGMVACFGSISHALLGVMLMVGEMTGTLALLAPAMIALGMAALVVGDATIYTGQLKDRVESTAHRIKFGLPLLAGVPATRAMSPPRLLLNGRELMDADVRLDGTTTFLDGDVVNIRSSDVVIDNPGRRRGGGPLRRALVHDYSDGLTMNWAADYPGGVTIEGNVLTAKAFDLVLDNPGRRRAAGGPSRRALVHDFNDGLTITGRATTRGESRSTVVSRLPTRCWFPHVRWAGCSTSPPSWTTFADE